MVHTTVPIHEVHHNEAKHHAASALPAVSMADFKRQGGSLTGREERYDGFDGEPRAVGHALGGLGGSGISQTNAGLSGNTTIDSHPHHAGHPTSGSHSDLASKADLQVNPDLDGSRNVGSYSKNSSTTGYGAHSVAHGTNTRGNETATSDVTGKKPSLLDRLNPMKDTDHDGKKGVME